MKKIIFSILALLLMVGVAQADSVPGNTDPQYNPTVWTQTVYNGSGDDIQSGLAVRWDCNASANDMAMWVEQVDNIAEPRTAGALPYGRSLSNGQIGEIVVKGPCIMFDNGNTTTAADVQEADALGSPVDETLGAADEAVLGWCINADASSVANTELGTNHYAVIFIDVSPLSGD